MKSKIAIVTGSGGILCGEIAKFLASQDYTVALLDLNYKAAKNIEDQIHQKGGKALAITCDVLDKDSIVRAKEIIEKDLGSSSVLINGAGGNHPKGTTLKEYLDMDDKLNDPEMNFYNLDQNSIKKVFDLNFLGTFLPCQVFTPLLKTQDNPVIINISSMNAYRPLTKIPAYSGAKAAVSNFTQWLAVHLSKVNIRVNAVAPGFFLTEQNRALLTNEDGTLSERGSTIIQHTPMNRFGEAKDLFSTIGWLCSPESSFITGIVVPVDGGFSAFSGV